MSPTLHVDSTDIRLDRYLSQQLPRHSRAEIQRWIRQGHVLVNGCAAKVSLKLAPGDTVTFDIPDTQPATLQAEAIPLVILYEDDDLIAVDKAAGMVVHPAPGHDSGTLVHAILYHCPDLQGVGGEQRPGIVHRLDKDTSGIILVAKNDQAHRYLQDQFRQRSIEKTYLALLIGQLEARQGRIDAPIARHPRHRKRMAIVPQGRAASTSYEVIAFYGGTTLVSAHPHTGRTHQIRVHFASLGHPIVGDTVYGPRRDPYRLGRHFLHAHRLRFRRPSDHSLLTLESPLPDELQALLQRLTP
ncbi:MAG: RluA family pseudouridine synthase [Chloroflexi bacterium]|nr:RluA family pseudouridine synthase [Chloroflexota bacterium]